MQRISNLRAPLSFSRETLRPFLAHALGIAQDRIIDAHLAKKSVDARRKDDVHFVLTLDFALTSGPAPIIPRGANLSETKEMPYTYPSCASPVRRPLVVGLGPAGLLAGYLLAKAGLSPLVIERGKNVAQRAKDVAHFFATGALNPVSNVQFGEGGAGTFSDGKLTTGIKDPRCNEVLRLFHEHGAPESILYEAKPHIGTDNLPGMVRGIRERITALGGDVRFETPLERLIVDEGRIVGAVIAGQSIEVDDVILAIGHSARDTLSMLHALGVPMQKKPFSLGVRIEHPQSLIDRSQYGAAAAHPHLGAADYKLHERTRSGRGVYTFCMCPGGEVVAASSTPGHLVVNGMSRYDRAGTNANSALLVSVTPDDFPEPSPLSGILFQEKWERIAYNLGGGGFRAPAQRVADFLTDRASHAPGDVLPSYRPGVTWCNLVECMPEFAASALREAIVLFDRKLNGFALAGAALTGIETRSSSPVTLLRDPETCASALGGLYPCGEGAGHAGGIMSAAVDGMRCAEALIARYAVE